MSFSSTRDYFRGSLRMLKENKDEAFDLLRMSLTSPHFDSERRRADPLPDDLRAAERHHQSRRALAGRKFLEMAYGNHPYGRRPNGTLESVPTITAADLKDYVRRVLAKDTLKVAVVGDIDADTLGKLLDNTFGGLPAKANLTPVPTSKPQSRRSALSFRSTCRRPS